ncbi:hypothetical protein C1646_669662 [Rhizophagus diaphanus]|nr:hypothetical protein C1646_669662 [Rhizophagus diaphanus] [Rhizophagus sp. MUCL 43196]
MTKGKILKEEWENIANNVENSLIDTPIDTGINEEDFDLWTDLKERIQSEINTTLDKLKPQNKSNKIYVTDLSKLSMKERFRRKIIIIEDLEKIIKDWIKFQKNSDNDFKKYGIRRINTRELSLIKKYKIAVNRFLKIDQYDEEYKMIKIDDVLDDNDKLKMISKELQKIKTHTWSDIKIQELIEKEQEINKNICVREHMMTSDLKEMIVQKFWSLYCFAEIATSDKFSMRTYIGDALIILKENGFNICNYEVRNDIYVDHRIKGGNITIEELLGDSFSLHRTSLRNCGTLFLEQLLELYTDRLLKWSHFIRMNNLSPRFEPKWFKMLKEKVTVIDQDERIVTNDIKIRRSDDKKRILLRKDTIQGSKKEDNRNLIIWNDNDQTIFSIKQKKSKHKKYNKIGVHLIPDGNNNLDKEIFNSLFLTDCKGCAYNIGRKLNKDKCFIHIKKELAITIKGRYEKSESGSKYFKPYMTSENIYLQNEQVVKNLVIDDSSFNIEMNIDEDLDSLIGFNLNWLEFIFENSNSLGVMRNFVRQILKDFIKKDIMVQIGAIVQKGEEFCLDGYFAIEIFSKNDHIEKFNFEGKILKIKFEQKVYIIALIVAILLLPCNVMVDLRIDSKIAQWLIDYSILGSVRRELDDKLYVYLNFVNTLLELKNIKLNIFNGKVDLMVVMDEVKLPALKMELIKGKDNIDEIMIKKENILVDEYALRWNNIPIDGAYRSCFKELSYNLVKMDLIFLDLREVYGILNNKCPCCMIFEETWDHIWICSNNGNITEIELFKDVIKNSVVDEENGLKQKDDIIGFEEKLLEITTTRSFIIPTEGILREVTQGIINDKWMSAFREVEKKKLLRRIFSEYLDNLRDKIWLIRYEETIKFEKQMGLIKDSKRKKVRTIEDTNNGETSENLENKKNIKRLKTLVKIDFENNIKDSVFRLGTSDRFKIEMVKMIKHFELGSLLVNSISTWIFPGK